jgi:S1-C subfamily serine protease
MHRLCQSAASVFLLCGLPLLASGQERSALKDALALQETLRDVIKRAQPAVASILVSRSDEYRRLTGYEPPADDPGRLGAFDPKRDLPASTEPDRGWRVGGRRPFWQRVTDDPVQKYDLSHPNYVPEAFGSGVVIDGEKLLILTNYHVVLDATKIYVRLPGDKGSYADIHAADPRSDLAVLRLIDEKHSIGVLPQIVFGDGAAMQKGDLIVTLANPFAAGFREGSPSASWGIVSGLHRRGASLMSSEEEVPFTPSKGLLPLRGTLIETDARLNLGCSGGALLNLRGEMVGLTTARAAISGSETAGGFAMPLDANFKRVIDRLKQGMEVEYGFLGIAAQSGSRGDGLLIGGDAIRDNSRGGAVTSGSPAARAGLTDGQVIKSINGVPMHEFDDLYLLVGTLQAGSEARLEIEGRRDVTRVELAKSFVPGKIIVSKKPTAVRGIRVDYTSVLFLQSQFNNFRRFMGGGGIQAGVFVREVLPDSPAAKARLKPNEIITQVNGEEVDSPAEFYKAAQKIAPGTPLELTLSTSEWNRTTTSTLTIP